MNAIYNGKYALVPIPNEVEFLNRLYDYEQKSFHANHQWNENNLHFDFKQHGDTNTFILRFYLKYEEEYFYIPDIYIEAAKAESLGVILFEDEQIWNNILQTFSEEQRAVIQPHRKYVVIHVTDRYGSLKYVVDPDNFNGSVYTSMRDGIHSDYGGETLQEIQDKEKNYCLKLVTPETLIQLVADHRKSICKPFEEITEERYWNWLEAVPPKRHRRNSFFVGECYQYDLYHFCFQFGDRYFTALRSIKLTNEELDSQINEFTKTLK